MFFTISCGKEHGEYVDDIMQEETNEYESDNSSTDNEEDNNPNEEGSKDENEENDEDLNIGDEEAQKSEDSNDDIVTPGEEDSNGSSLDNTENNSEGNNLQNDSTANDTEEDSKIEENNTAEDDENTTSLYKVEKYMNLSCPSGFSAQGSANSGNYLFQGYAGNKIFTVYDLRNKTCIGSYDTKGPYNARIHANTLNFGSQRYVPDDEFPVLYVSSGYTINGNSQIYAYRIQRQGDDFYFNLVQTVTLKGFGSWTEGILDNENNYLWIKYEKNGSGGPYGYAKFNVPDISIGDVIIEYDNYLDDFLLPAEPYPSSNQGHVFHDNRIILVSGVPAKNEKLAYISINTESHERETIIDLAENGLVNKNAKKDNAYEPEGCIFFDDVFMICYRNFIYTFQIDE